MRCPGRRRAGEAEEGNVLLVEAVPSCATSHYRGEHGRTHGRYQSCGDRDGSAQAVGDDQGDGRGRDRARQGSLRDRPDRLRGHARGPVSNGPTGSGRSRAARASASTSCCDCWTVAGKTRKLVALELVVDLERLYARKKAANKELVDLLKQTRTSLLDLHGIGPSGAARLLVSCA